MIKGLKKVTCLNCGRVSMGASLTWCQEEMNSFNKYFDTLDDEGKEAYGLKYSSLDNFRCCEHMKLSLSKPRDCLAGITLSTVIWEGK